MTKEVVEVDTPPPLPPKKRTNVFQPTMAVRPGNVRQERPASVPGFGSGRSWKHERETAMMRVEAQRNSLVLSSDEEIEQQNFRREVAQQGSVLQRTQVTNEMLQGNYNPLSVTDLCHIPEMGEPFPSELDFSQITSQTSVIFFREPSGAPTLSVACPRAFRSGFAASRFYFRPNCAFSWNKQKLFQF